MKVKISGFFLLLLALAILGLGCSAPTKTLLPTPLSLEDSLKQIIITKGEDYDFMGDSSYMDHMEELALEIVNNKTALPPHYSVGRLNEEPIPYLLVFQERNPENLKDEGSLEVYKFNGDKYSLVDKLSMNYDNYNYQMEIGKLSENQRGIYLNNNVGSHAGITYGFILEDDKLVSILDEEKISLLSIYTNNEIKDIDGDDILEFSIFTVDPETEASSLVDSEKMTLWYRWNGKDSGDLIQVDRKDYSKEASNKDVFIQAEEIIDNRPVEFLDFLEKNKGQLSKYDNGLLITKYRDLLEAQVFSRSLELNQIFTSYLKDDNFDYLLGKYSLTQDKFLENLNSLEYLKREKVLKDETLLKEDLIKNISMGYKLASAEGSYYYIIDNQKFLDKFEDSVLNEYGDYLRILALNSNEAYMQDGSLIIPLDKLAERILQVESFKMVYPYSDLLAEVDNIYHLYLSTYFYGDLHQAAYDEKTLKIKDQVLEELYRARDKYPHTGFANKINYFLDLITENNFLVDEEVKSKFIDWIK